MLKVALFKHYASSYYSIRHYCANVHGDLVNLLKDYKKYSDVFVNDIKFQAYMKEGSNLKQNAVLVPFVRSSSRSDAFSREKIWVLFTLRANHLRSHSNEISFPGGRVEVGETFEHAALRECQEEIGIAIKPTDIIAHLSPIPHTRKNDTIVPIVCMIESTLLQKVLPNATEVNKVILVPVKQLMADIRYTTFRQKDRQKDRYRLPVIKISRHWDVNGEEGDFKHMEYRVWGLTALILHKTFSALSNNAF